MWDYNYKNKDEQKKCLVAFIVNCKNSRIASDLSNQSVEELFDCGIIQIEDVISYISGNVNKLHTNHILKCLVEDLSKEDLIDVEYSLEHTFGIFWDSSNDYLNYDRDDYLNKE